jgi:hypothetical protein
MRLLAVDDDGIANDTNLGDLIEAHELTLRGLELDHELDALLDSHKNQEKGYL